MRLYLSSFRMGDHPEHLAALVGGGGRRAVVIANAMDDAPADVRRGGVERELAALTDLGFDAVELDLRDYFGQERRLRRDLAGVALAWLRGGNVFMLRFALFRSAGDVVFGDLLAADALVYAGYSAGACVLSSTLRGLGACRRRWRGHADLRLASQCGMAWRCSKRRSSRTISHRGIPRRPRWTSWPPGTRQQGSVTGPCATGRLCSSMARIPRSCSPASAADDRTHARVTVRPVMMGWWATAMR